jgi:hypothetical protein
VAPGLSTGELLCSPRRALPLLKAKISPSGTVTHSTDKKKTSSLALSVSAEDVAAQQDGRAPARRRPGRRRHRCAPQPHHRASSLSAIPSSPSSFSASLNLSLPMWWMHRRCPASGAAARPASAVAADAAWRPLPHTARSSLSLSQFLSFDWERVLEHPGWPW